MTQINAYLRFDGNCREAMTFYKDCLGGELTLLTVAGSPMESQMPPEAGQNIMHSCLTNGERTLMATDMGPGELVPGNLVSLMLNCSSQEEIEKLFSWLSAGGEVSCPLEEAFWGATFGHLTDQFGVNWILHYDKNPQK